uniref:Uncharacterized protein LOC111101774 n=1 Tax=Crassostrea virginica TaxID=6565 RepID=A0A8B8AFX9_CRAVI|nr:uncharacterized protein LOC111101774 [Crassostrea virginica]
MASVYLLLFWIYALHPDLVLSVELADGKCKISEVSACESGEPGVHFDHSLDACNYYEYWGTCLKLLKASCSGDPFYEERVYSHQFDGSYYCPWLFPGDQPAPGCNKRKMLQCRNKTDKDGDYSSCSYYENYMACLETFRANCSGYHIYQDQLYQWKWHTYLDCPRLLGCNITVYKACWDRVEWNRVNIYDLSSFKLLCGDDLNRTMTCLQDQMDRCQHMENSEIVKNKWEYHMLVYSCYGIPECNLQHIHQCALDHYSENLWMMVVPTPKQVIAVCRNHRSYLNCIAPYKDACIQNKHRLAKGGSELLSIVVDRMETLYKYVTLLCVEHNQDILQYGADCYDAVLTKSALTSCDFNRTPMEDYAPDIQRCQSLQNETACIRVALSKSDKCGEESEETALKMATSFEQFLLSLHHGFTCDGLTPVPLTTVRPTTEKPITTTPHQESSATESAMDRGGTSAATQSPTMTSQREASAAHRTRYEGWFLNINIALLLLLILL